ncbi:MAG TPA: hypothetical protein VKB46_19730, partial [Pyrinomonadaceae bacterium]|nr:hypothetical protein [Pyrinomonadaceae bacterium]
VLQLADQVNRVARPRWFDSQLSSEWSQIQRELRVISDTYGYGYRNGGRDDDYRRGNQNDDWWRRIPIPFPR